MLIAASRADRLQDIPFSAAIGREISSATTRTVEFDRSAKLGKNLNRSPSGNHRFTMTLLIGRNAYNCH
jgi:hypothetical protein